jgi:phosphopantothenoylcysteine decarboxylase / phosphopantothenate---cysteine ligase
MIKKILITAGPTREHLDPVRFITNLSTGEMGYALADAAKKKGYRVTLVSGPTNIKPPKGVLFHPVISAEQMKKICTKLFRSHDCLIMTAAVSDFMPPKALSHKIPSVGGITLRLKRTPDILASLSRHKGRRTVIGFCLETRDLIKRATAKLRKKGLDGIVANYYDAKRHIPFGKRNVDVVLISKAGRILRISGMSKTRLAGRILAWVEDLKKPCKNPVL